MTDDGLVLLADEPRPPRTLWLRLLCWFAYGLGAGFGLKLGEDLW